MLPIVELQSLKHVGRSCVSVSALLLAAVDGTRMQTSITLAADHLLTVVFLS